MKRLRDPFYELGHRMPFKRTIVAQPKRSYPVIEKVERNCSDSRKSGFIDPWIEVRVNAGFRHHEFIGSTKNKLRNANLHLVFCHAHSKSKQLRSVRKLG